MWELDYLTGTGRLEAGLAQHLRALCESDSVDEAYGHSFAVEDRVAPHNGGLYPGALEIVEVLAQELPHMDAAAVPAALELLVTTVHSSSLYTTELASQCREAFVSHLALFAGIAQRGDSDVRVASVGLISLTAQADGRAHARATYYLTRLAHDPDSKVRRDALVELGELGASPPRS